MAKTMSLQQTDEARPNWSGRYRLEAQLAHSGYGTLFEAHDRLSERQVLVHCLGAGDASSERFLQEVSRLVQMDHPNIAAPLDGGEQDGELFLVRQVLEGESLHDQLKREHRLRLGEAFRVARDLCSGLSYAHCLGYVHGELTPSNVWIERSGVVRLLGLGSSGVQDTGALLDRFDARAASAYRSPEQAAGERMTFAADLFSLGCLLYQMTTGNEPFTGPDSSAVLRAIVFDQPPDARVINPELSECRVN